MLHDLHESVTLLYVSTGTGPYNPIVDPIQVNEWWLLAQTEIMEMTKRNVPGVWTYNYYDGWVPNYMFWIGVTHNSIGRFYETQSYGGAVTARCRVHAEPRVVPAEPDARPTCTWGPRDNVNMQQSALLIAMNHVAKNKETFLENYYLKNKHTIERGQTKAPYAYVIPAEQRRRVEAAELMNLIRREGAEVHTRQRGVHASAASQVAPGDYIVRLDQPYGGDRRDAARRAVLRAGEPASVRRHRLGDPAGAQRQDARAIDDKAIFDKPMTLAAARLQDCRHHHRHRPRADRRSHDRQHAGDVPLPAHRT